MDTIRVFPRRTHWTPTDLLAYVGEPPLPMFRPSDPLTPVQISVTFEWDLEEASRLRDSWSRFYDHVSIGGPALGGPSKESIPGQFVKPGIVFTSRGCPNHCWFCKVWKREPGVIELPIVDGWNVADDNILATSRVHFERVCEMLGRQEERAVFSGGLEAARLTSWHAKLLVDLHPDRLYFAYDTPDDYKPLVEARKILDAAGIPQGKHVLMAYVLIGYPDDTREAAEERLRQTMDAGFTPMAMLYRNKHGKHGDLSWLHFQRSWARAQLIYRRAA